jgi:hypothetical protein
MVECSSKWYLRCLLHLLDNQVKKSKTLRHFWRAMRNVLCSVNQLKYYHLSHQCDGEIALDKWSCYLARFHSRLTIHWAYRASHHALAQIDRVYLLLWLYPESREKQKNHYFWSKLHFRNCYQDVTTTNAMKVLAEILITTGFAKF